MAKWSITASVVGSKYVGEVEADTQEEAIEKGWKHPNAYCSVCHACSDDIEDPELQELFAEKRED